MLEATATARDFMEADVQSNPNAIEIDRTMPRCVVFAGDVLTAEYKYQTPEMRMGGEYLGQEFRTLRLTKWRLRRCQLTPLVMGYDILNDDTLGDEKDKAKSRSFTDPQTQQTTKQYYYDCNPGDEIASMVTSGVADMGIREVDALRGATPDEISAYQRGIFPEWDSYLDGSMEFFPTVAATERYLQGRLLEVDAKTQSIIRTLLQSTDRYRRWGTAYLDRMARMVKAPPTDGGQVYGWTELAMALFDQLELNRDEFLMKKAEVAINDTTQAELIEMRKQFAAIMPAIGALAEDFMAKKAADNAVAAVVPVVPDVINNDVPKVQIGDVVTIDGKRGEVKAKHFGRVKIEFEDGTTTEIPTAKLQQ